MSELFSTFLATGAWAVIRAVLLLLVAFLCAKIVKSLVNKALSKTKWGAGGSGSDTASEGRGKTVDFLGRLMYLLVFLLFVPGIFDSLGLGEMSAPILNLLNTMWGYLPNVLAAVIVLWVGFFIAKLVRELLVPVFGKLKVNRLQEKAGLDVTDSAKLSNTLAYIVYVLILIPVVITALQVLNIQAISAPAVKMLDVIFAFIPNILAALMIIVIGCTIAKFAGGIVESLIASAGLDAKLSNLLDSKAPQFILSKVIGRTVSTVMVIFFIVESFSVLHLQVVTNIGSAIIGYLPYVLAAVLILMACYVVNAIIQKALRKGEHTGAALVSKCAIYTIGVFMVLNELGIAGEIVNTAFILIVAALAVAFAISFGIGGREFAGRMLKRLEDAYCKGGKTEQ